jgi:hypothetical protein
VAPPRRCGPQGFTTFVAALLFDSVTRASARERFVICCLFELYRPRCTRNNRRRRNFRASIGDFGAVWRTSNNFRRDAISMGIVAAPSSGVEAVSSPISFIERHK